MNYIKLINRFWTCSAERAFNPSDCMLYFFLLNTCNTLGWKQPFGQSDRYLSMMLGISVPTVRDAKNRLKQRGLINFRPPMTASKAFDGQTRYEIPGVYELQRTSTVQDSFTQDYGDTFSENLGEDYGKDYGKSLTNNKLNKTKQNETISLSLPFASKKFVWAWNELIETPKWKRKSVSALQTTLNQLGQFDEEFAVALLVQGVIGDWNGLVFAETHQKFEKWKQSATDVNTAKKRSQQGDATRRKSEIVDRAARAASACRRRNS